MAAWQSTGIAGLDDILSGLRPGDNVVWRVDSVDDYRRFVLPFVQAARRAGRKVIYFRFATHEPLIPQLPGVTIIRLDASRGFETFTLRLHDIIGQEGVGACYVFDCLSDLLGAWATDTMVGNFFAVTCPYLFELDTLAYFALRRHSHSFKTVARIRSITQLLLDLHTLRGAVYIHPLKVWQRSSPTMFLPHLLQGERLVPLTRSYEATELFAGLGNDGLEASTGHLDHWDRLFMHAAELIATPESWGEREEMLDRLCRMLLSRDKQMLQLVRTHFLLEDLLRIRSRQIGTGFIGGKAVGMLLARQILLRDRTADWQKVLEPHDSFYVGSDLFYSYIIHNGWWRLFVEQRSREGYFSAAALLRDRLLNGEFPPEIREEFRKMLEYFGQYPIIVRSSSLLEDGFGNAFAGKYDSYFCVNQGSPDERFSQFEEAVRRIFSSTMSEDALSYRLQRGLDRQDEQMALLVQRVSGSYRGNFFFPDLAGVGVSYNTYVWNRELNPQAGMLRLVAGLGTRAVDRVEGDYPRLVALDRPMLVPHAGTEDQRRFAQRDVDLLNVVDNCWQTVALRRLVAEGVDLPLELVGTRDQEGMARLAERGMPPEELWLPTFERLLTATDFPQLMGRMLKSLEAAYRYPVDVEFTANVTADRRLLINVVQCRPLQTKGVQKKRVEIPGQIDATRLLFRSVGNFMGGSVVRPLTRVVFVDPEEYTLLSHSEKYHLARLVGRLNRLDEAAGQAILIGPGRWGTSTPALGVPVRFAEINRFAAIGEVAFAAGGLMPELSFGSHFFQDLVESDIFYVALFPDQAGCQFHPELLAMLPNRLPQLFPEEERFAGVLRVCDTASGRFRLLADIVSQDVACFLD